MYEEKESPLEHTSAQLALEYMKVWDSLLEQGKPEELARLHQHMVDRVLWDALDSPDTRMALAVILASRCDVLVDVCKALRKQAGMTEYATWKESFEAIARGEETEVQLAGMDGQMRFVVFEHGVRFERNIRERADATTLRWSFVLGAPGTDRKSERYFNISCLTVGSILPLIERELARQIETAPYQLECLSIFENCVRRALFTNKMPSELRRAVAGAAFTPYSVLTPPSVATADPTVPLEVDETALAVGSVLGRGNNLVCLRKIAMQIANGGLVSATLHREDECLMRVEYKSGERQVVLTNEDVWDYEEEDMVEALRRLQGADFSEPDGGALDPRPLALAKARQRKHPRPNEPCSCGSGRKYKRCCGSH